MLAYLGLTIWALVAISLRSPLSGQWQRRNRISGSGVADQDMDAAWTQFTADGAWQALSKSTHGWTVEGAHEDLVVVGPERPLWRVIVSSWQ